MKGRHFDYLTFFFPLVPFFPQLQYEKKAGGMSDFVTQNLNLLQSITVYFSIVEFPNVIQKLIHKKDKLLKFSHY